MGVDSETQLQTGKTLNYKIYCFKSSLKSLDMMGMFCARQRQVVLAKKKQFYFIKSSNHVENDFSTTYNIINNTMQNPFFLVQAYLSICYIGISTLKVIYHPLYGINNYVLIWGDWLSCDPLRGLHDSQSPHIRKHLCPILWRL